MTSPFEVITNEQKLDDQGNGPASQARAAREMPVPLSEAPKTLPPFPLDALPAWLGIYCRAVACALEVPPDFAGMLALAVLSAAVAGKLTANPWQGWTEPINLFVLIVAAPAERKSPAYKAMFAPAVAWESETRKRVAADIAAKRSERKAYEKALAHAEAELAEATDDGAKARARTRIGEIAAYLQENDEPHVPRVFIDDVSAEKLAEALARHGGRLTLASPEGHGFFARAGGQYSRGEASLDVFLKAHGAETILVDRMQRGSLVIEHPTLTIILCLQPGVLRSLGGKHGFRAAGLLARFLVAMPAPRVGSRTHETAPVPKPVRDAYEHHVKALLDLPNVAAGETPPLLKFDVGASARIRDFAKEIEPKLAPDGELAAISDWAGKIVGQTVRIAGLLHVADGERLRTLGKVPWDDIVEAATAVRAVAIARTLIAHAQRAFGSIDAGEDGSRAEYVLARVLALGKLELTRKDILRAARRVRADELTKIIVRLVEHGYLEPVPTPGVRGERFAVHGLLGTKESEV